MKPRNNVQIHQERKAGGPGKSFKVGEELVSSPEFIGALIKLENYNLQDLIYALQIREETLLIGKKL